MAEIGPIASGDLTALLRAVLAAAGVAEDEAGVVAAHVVDAEERENRSQGLVRIPAYVTWARRGEITSPTSVTVERDGGAVLVLDAHNGWGHVAAADAMARCVERAKRSGVCVAVVRNTNHIGRLGAYVEAAAAAGTIGLIACAGNPKSSWVAPWGGTRPIFGTNPLAIGFPRGDGPPVVVDISTTQGARGNVLLAQKVGALLPEGWAFDAGGAPTRDPRQALPPHGTLAPLGGHKGYALAVALEILCGVLAGIWPPESSANFVGAIDVEAFLPMETYEQSLAGLAEEITSGPRRPGVDAIHLPGEGSAARKRRSAARGLMVSSEMWAEIASLAAGAGVTHPLLETWRTTA
ncbi:MAG TPA: Ldh family oxidoreductase [bacterium]|nr:Ldh family oxidoreductase [bacterium]